jgi:hypothetical protein
MIPPSTFCCIPGTVGVEGDIGKVLVLYDLVSGNTAKMAKLVAEKAESIAAIEVVCASLRRPRPTT